MGLNERPEVGCGGLLPFPSGLGKEVLKQVEVDGGKPSPCLCSDDLAYFTGPGSFLSE